MMDVEKIVGDIILLVLDNHESLKIGIDQNKIFVKIKDCDENRMWIHHPGFLVPNLRDENKETTKKIVTSTSNFWAFIIFRAHFLDAEIFDFPPPFEQYIGFN
tara:strand:+ start:203 stop:511 length:309 start_codon:yes stop_codon:yes gene_type:complete